MPGELRALYAESSAEEEEICGAETQDLLSCSVRARGGFGMVLGTCDFVLLAYSFHATVPHSPSACPLKSRCFPCHRRLCL